MSTSPAPAAARLPARDPPVRDALALPGVAVAALALGATGDPVGVGAAVLLASTWLIAPPVAVATLGAFLFVTVAPAGALGAAAIAGLGLALLAPTLRAATPARALLWTAAIALALGGLAVWSAATWSLPVAAGTLLLAAALLGYATHRVAVVTVEQPTTPTEVTEGG